MAPLSDLLAWLTAHRAPLLLAWLALGWLAMLPDLAVPLRRRLATDPSDPARRVAPWWRFVQARRSPWVPLTFAVALVVTWLVTIVHGDFWGGVLLGWLPGFVVGTILRQIGPWLVLVGTAIALAHLAGVLPPLV